MSEKLAVENKRGLSPAALLVAGAFFMEFIDGTVIATALLNLIAAASFTPAAPSLWLVVLLTAATVVAAALPSTSRALHLRRRAEPRQPDEPGK